MKKLIHFILISLLLLTLTSCMKNTTSITPTTIKNDYSNLFKGINDLNENSKQYEIKYFEIEEDVMGYVRSILNPYKSKDIKIESTITSPTSIKINKDAYYKLDYEIKYDDFLRVKDSAKNLNTEHFIISYKPKESGLHKIDVNVYIKDELTQTFTKDFEVVPNDIDYKGVIKVSPNKKSFMFENGETYIPVGENIGWYTSGTLKSFEYDMYFEKLKNVNANYVRIWLKYDNFNLHMGSPNAKVDDFSARMAELERLDRVLKIAEDNGIYLCIALLNHGQFSKRVNPEWSKNPYSELIEYPFQFFSRAEIKDIYKDELRYIISRYTEYDSIFTYELFNEVDWTDSYDKTRSNSWHKEMSEYIKSIDPYDRLITTSFMNNSNGSAIFKYDSIDYYTIHTYNYQASSGITQKVKNEAQNAYNSINKPVLFEEWGVNADSGYKTYETDPDGIMLYQALYGSLFSSSGSAMTWWWDTYIERYNLYESVFKGPFTISKLMDLSSDFTYLSLLDMPLNDNRLNLLGIKTENDIYLYIYDTSFTKLSESKTLFDSITIDYNLDGYTPHFYDASKGIEIDNNLDNLSFENDIVIILNKNK